jgi:hypothetical protein
VIKNVSLRPEPANSSHRRDRPFSHVAGDRSRKEIVNQQYWYCNDEQSASRFASFRVIPRSRRTQTIWSSWPLAAAMDTCILPSLRYYFINILETLRMLLRLLTPLPEVNLKALITESLSPKLTADENHKPNDQSRGTSDMPVLYCYNTR